MLHYGVIAVGFANIALAALQVLLRRRQRHADPRRVHELEYDLGLRDDPPPPDDRPGGIIHTRNVNAVLKDAWVVPFGRQHPCMRPLDDL